MLEMSNPLYVKSEVGKWASEGIRDVGLPEFGGLGLDVQVKIETILDAMDWPELIVFWYDGSDRVVAPFVVGISSDGNPLMRGYQLEGVSRSGKGEGWRVFQIRKMVDLDRYFEWFEPDDFDFDQDYPWIYRVLYML